MDIQQTHDTAHSNSKRRQVSFHTMSILPSARMQSSKRSRAKVNLLASMVVGTILTGCQSVQTARHVGANHKHSCQQCCSYRSGQQHVAGTTNAEPVGTNVPKLAQIPKPKNRVEFATHTEIGPPASRKVIARSDRRETSAVIPASATDRTVGTRPVSPIDIPLVVATPIASDAKARGEVRREIPLLFVPNDPN